VSRPLRPVAISGGKLSVFSPQPQIGCWRSELPSQSTSGLTWGVNLLQRGFPGQTSDVYDQDNVTVIGWTLQCQAPQAAQVKKSFPAQGFEAPCRALADARHVTLMPSRPDD
jgi:hypothetical protein